MKALAEQITELDGVEIFGRVVGVRGLMVEVAGPIHAMSVGARVVIETGANRFVPCEVIGFAGLAWSFYPYVVPNRLTIWQAASAPESLAFILVGTVVVLPIISARKRQSHQP